MKRIYFLRHAKAEKTAKNDLKRELSDKGKDDIKNLSKRLKKDNIKIDIIFTSNANRAVKTAKILTNNIKFKGEIIIVEEFYGKNYEFYFNFIKAIPNNFENILIIGHNPAITEICEFLSGMVISNVPTCGFLSLEFENLNFNEIEKNSGQITLFKSPKKDD